LTTNLPAANQVSSTGVLCPLASTDQRQSPARPQGQRVFPLVRGEVESETLVPSDKEHIMNKTPVAASTPRDVADNGRIRLGGTMRLPASRG
jgi:hypothetical protein